MYSDMQSVVGFSVIPKCMTLNDLERLYHVEFCFRAGLAGSDHATFKKPLRAYCQWRKSLARSLVSGSIRPVRIFGRVL